MALLLLKGTVSTRPSIHSEVENTEANIYLKTSGTVITILASFQVCLSELLEWFVVWFLLLFGDHKYSSAPHLCVNLFLQMQ